MKAGISIWSVHPYMMNQAWDHERFFAFAKESGAEGVELLTYFLDFDPITYADMGKMAEKYRMPIGCISASNDFATFDADLFQKGVKDILRALSLAEQTGAQVVRIFAGDLKPDLSYEQAKGQIVEGLKRVAEEAEKRKIGLGIENHGRLAGKALQVKELIEAVQSDYVGSTFDMGNFILVGEDPLHAYKILEGHVLHVHAKDFGPAATAVLQGRKYYTGLDGLKYMGLPPGEGLVPLSKLMEKMKERKYPGWLMVEYEGNEEPSEGTVQALSALKEAGRDGQHPKK